MRKETFEKIINALEVINHDKFYKNEIDNVINFNTFKKYVKVEKVKEVEYIPTTLEYLVKELNSCAGADCWGANWEYTIIDGKPFEVVRNEYYKVIEINL